MGRREDRRGPGLFLVGSDGARTHLGPRPIAVHVDEVPPTAGTPPWTTVVRVWRTCDLGSGGCGLCPLSGCKAVHHASGLSTCHIRGIGHLTDEEAVTVSRDPEVTSLPSAG
jgi:hypothetical protein